MEKKGEMRKSKAMVDLEGTEEIKYGDCLSLPFSLLPPTYLVTTQAPQHRGLPKLRMAKGAGGWRGMAEGFLSDGWAWAPKQFANDESTKQLLPLLCFLDHSSLTLLIRINCNYKESNENSVLLR